MVLENLGVSLLPPLIKSLIFFSLLFWWYFSHYWLSLVLVLLSAFYFYLRPLLNASQLLPSFLIILGSAILTKIYFSDYFLIFFAFFWGLLFFLLLGIKNLVFVRRRSIYYFLNSVLFLIIFLFFFRSDKSYLFFLKYLLSGLALFLILREFLLFEFRESARGAKVIDLISFSLAFLILGIVWGIALLPLGFINSAILALINILILRDFAFHHLAGTISRQIVLKNTTLFLVLNIIVFIFSKWSL